MSILGYSIFKILFFIGIATVGWLVAYGIRKGLEGFHWSHNKKYVRLNMYTNWNCGQNFHLLHDENGWWATAATWVCIHPGCNETGVDCLGDDPTKWWKIENGRVMIDEKKVTSPPTDIRTPRQVMNERRAQEQGLPRAVYAGEAIKVLTDLAVLAKKGQIQATTATFSPPLKEVSTAHSEEEQAKKEEKP